MAQSTVLAAGKTNATSSLIQVAAGETVKIGMFIDTGSIPAGVSLNILSDTPGADAQEVNLTAAAPSVLIDGPGGYYVQRTVQRLLGLDVNIGAYTDD